MKVRGEKKKWLCLNSAFPYGLFLLVGPSVTFFGGVFWVQKELQL